MSSSDDDDVDAAGPGENRRVGGDGDAARLDRRIDGGGRFGVDGPVFGEARHGGGGLGLRRAHLGDGTEAQARHAVQLHHDVGAHLAAAREADGDGSPRLFAGLQFGNERGDACDHFFFVPFLAAAAFFGTSRRTSPVTEGASVFLNSPACLP